jgi:hypothetical protein
MTTTAPSRTRTLPARTMTRTPPSEQRVAAVTAMLDRAQLELHVPREQAVHALALTLGRHRVGSKHAAVVGLALSGRVPDHERPPAGQAIRRLISRGQPAYTRAVRAEVERMAVAAAAHPARITKLIERLTPTAERDGPRAAEVVIRYWRHWNRPPTPTELAHTLGWSTSDAWPMCRRLLEADWLEIHRKQLHPGSRARQAMPPRPVIGADPSSADE